MGRRMDEAGLEKSTRSMLTIAMLAAWAGSRARRAYPRDAQHGSDQGRSEGSAAASRGLRGRAGGQFGVCHRQAGVQRDGDWKGNQMFPGSRAR